MPLIKPKIPVIFLSFANEFTEQGFLRQLTRELKEVMNALEPAVQKDHCQLRILPAATSGEIADIFQDEWYDGRVWIFHYGGHASEDQLWMEGENGGNQGFFSLGLARFLGAQKDLKLVFLNGCATHEHAQLLLDAGIPAVIVTSRKIEDNMATQFATTFYRGLAGGASIEEAYGEAEGLVRGDRPNETFATEATRSLYWEDQELSDGHDFPWRLYTRDQGSWFAGQWRLFYELEENGSAEEEVEADRFVGEMIDQYRVLELLGEGTMGAVFKVLHTQFNEERAMKVTHRVEEGYNLLRNIVIGGSKGLQSIRHPNVVRLFDAGEVVLFGQKRLYSVMELAAGERLDRWSQNQPFGTKKEFDRLIEIFVQICSGVEAAHRTTYTDDSGVSRTGIVHGNMKTRKILFTNDGTPKLIDFMFADLSRSPGIKLDRPEAAEKLMRSENPAAYLPPEVIDGRSPINAQTDIYGLGCVFFEVLTGTTINELSFQSEEELHRFLRQKHRLVPRNLVKVIWKSTMREPSRRYTMVKEMMSDLLEESAFGKRVFYFVRRLWPF